MNTCRGKKVLLISSGQPSFNPRLVKEADSLVANGYDVKVFYSYWNDLGASFDKTLLPAKKWKAVCIGGDPENTPWLYITSKLIHKAARIINRKTGGRRCAEFAIARSGCLMIRAAKKCKADLYIAHNLGALAAAVKAAHANKKRCGFDAEDFHRNEITDDLRHPDVMLKTFLENEYFPRVDYLSTSSPSIAFAYKSLFPEKNFSVLLNVFPSDSAIPKPVSNINAPIRLFWFSQTIGTKRGLEDVTRALELLKDYPFELHLLGYLPEDTKINYIDKLINNVNITFHEPIPSDQLPEFSSKFDIGLALEPAFSNNNDMAISNKIFTYLQGGLGIVASDTKAQGWLLTNYPEIGMIYKKGDPEALADVLLYYHQHRDELIKTRLAAFEIARTELNWETEGKKFLNLVKQTLIQE